MGYPTCCHGNSGYLDPYPVLFHGVSVSPNNSLTHSLTRSRQLVARLRRRIQHDTQYIHPVQSSHGNRTAFLPVVLPQGRPCTRPTHAHGWAGGCCLLRSGCADPLPARSCSGGPRDRPNPSPRYRTRSICRAEGESETAEPDETLPPDPLIPCESFAGRPGATRVRPRSPPAPLPPGPDPPSTRAILAAPLGVTRDTRKGRDARAGRRSRQVGKLT